MNLNKEEFKNFLSECKVAHEEDTKFLLEHGWVKDADNIWVSPKGRRCRNHLGLFNDEFDLEQGLAIDVAKHEIVLEQFEQFKVELFDEDDENDADPSDLFFPCIKEGKLYSYIDAVNIAVYNDNIHVTWDKYDAVIDYLSQFDTNTYNKDSVIKLTEFSWFDDDVLRYRFELRN